MGKWIVDQVHSRVGFEVKHLMVSKVRGQFDSYNVNIDAEDLCDLTDAKIEFIFNAESINTLNRERDRHLKSVDFFDTQNFPTINFNSNSISKSSNGYKVEGYLTIKDITNPIIFNVRFSGKAKDLNGVETYAFEAEAIINREQFGLMWNATLESGGVLVGKEVKITAELELKPQHHTMFNSSELSDKPNIEEKQLKHQKSKNEIHAIIAENLTDLVLIIDKDGVIQYVTSSIKTVLNYDAQLYENANLFEFIHQDEQAFIRNEVFTYANRALKKELRNEFRLLHSEGHYIYVEANFISINDYALSESKELLVVIRDISERKEAETAIYKLAFQDTLTSLPNRRLFMNQLRSEVMERKFSKSKMSLLYIDLDNFKSINDQYGHESGDVVLKEAAKRIQSVIRPTDIAARFGGDEFVVMLRDVQDTRDSISIAQRILTQFQKPIVELDQHYLLTCSIGVAHFPEHGVSTEDLIKNADTALYYVKERSKNDFMVFEHYMEHQSLERRILENALRQGIKDQQFFLEYQPKINIATKELVGMEALVRWKHPELGVIAPGKFIPLAEETGLIVPLGEWILRESCRQAVAWQAMDYPPLNLSVNVSVRQMEDLNFVDKVKAILIETGLNPKQLEIEITESVIASGKSTISILGEIRELGISISIDDFGTGYSSLSYIKNLPIDVLKIDQSFVKDIHNNRESQEITKAIINLAKSIGLKVIAEGIELEEHVEVLNKEGYIFGQGYYFSRPLGVGAFEEFIINN